MFTIIASNISSWFQQTDHGASIVPDLLSFGSRSVLVGFSLGSRQVLVRLSFVIRQSIEDRTRTERGTSKKRTKEQRISIEMPTRNYRQLDDLPPSWLAEYPSATTNQHTAPHHTPAEADSSTFSPTQNILMANQAFSTHSVHSLFQSPQKPLTSSKKPFCTKPNNRPKHTTLPTLNPLPQHDNRIRYSLNSRLKTTFSKPKEQS